MTPADFQKHRNAFNGYCESLLGSKGKDYSENEDRLSNFKQVAERSGQTPLQVWAVLSSKHQIAIESFVKNGDLASESVRSRFADLRNYLDLGLALIEEEKQPSFEGYTVGHATQWQKKVDGKFVDVQHVSPAFSGAWNLTDKAKRKKLRSLKKPSKSTISRLYKKDGTLRKGAKY